VRLLDIKANPHKGSAMGHVKDATKYLAPYLTSFST